MLQLDFVLKTELVTNGRVQRPWRILDIFLSNYQCKEYHFLFGWSKNFRGVAHSYTTHPLACVCVCVCVVYPYAVLDVQRSVPEEESIVLSSRHWLAFCGIILEGRRSQGPRCNVSRHTHATDQTKGFDQRQMHVWRRMTNEITEYAEWNSGDLRST